MNPPQKLNHPCGILDLCVLIWLAEIVYKGLGIFDEIHHHLLEFIRSLCMNPVARVQCFK